MVVNRATDQSGSLPERGRGGSGRAHPIAALDLGTNNCRLLIARPRHDGFQVIDSFSRAVRLGEHVEQTGMLSDAAMGRAIEALAICAEKIRRNGVRRMRAVATEACRRAVNRLSFIDRVRAETGLRMDIISAEEEARLAVAGCAPLLDDAAERLLVIDIGGGSTELILLDLSGTPTHLRGRLLMALAPARRGVLEADARARAAGAHIHDWISVPLGVATLHDRHAHVTDARARFEAMRAEFGGQLARFERTTRHTDGVPLQIIGASGTVTTIAGAYLGLRRYDRNRVDGMWLPAAGAAAVIEQLVALDDTARESHPGLGADRSLLIVAGAAILSVVMAFWPCERIRVADRGLREGLLYALIGEGMGPAHQRRQQA
jgi:exopolyphosphatase/guanosine-5'-triphosphate,3'-diphosphate pyrophosphatase